MLDLLYFIASIYNSCNDLPVDYYYNFILGYVIYMY